MSDKKKLVMFDGNAILHRAYHAFPPTLKTKDGQLTNAIYGFTSTMLNVFKKMKPTHVVVAFDEKGETFRHKKFKAYKASRPKMDEELISQIDKTREVVKTMNIPIFVKEGYEADDILGTISRKAEEQNFEEIVIVTGDKDILQLLTEKIRVFYPSRGRQEEKIYDIFRFEKEYEFKPKQLIDFKGLAGDPSDEIPGVRGIGPKTATNLIKKFESIENIYKNIERISGKVRENLEINKENAILSKELATIDLSVPIDFVINNCLLKDYDKEKVFDLFGKLEFFSLVKRLPNDSWEEMAVETFEKKENKKPNENQMSLF